MADVLIRTPKEWEDFTRLKVQEKIPEKDSFFVEHDMATDFSMWAIRNAMLRGLAFGIIGTLFFVVMLGIVVRLFL